MLNLGNCFTVWDQVFIYENMKIKPYRMPLVQNTAFKTKDKCIQSWQVPKRYRKIIKKKRKKMKTWGDLGMWLECVFGNVSIVKIQIGCSAHGFRSNHFSQYIPHGMGWALLDKSRWRKDIAVSLGIHFGRRVFWRTLFCKFDDILGLVHSESVVQ